ncbi:MAG TPA: thymidylate synthase [Mollicutes bacterium]|nr:thymidylate synthase [Mollicutes bacterium]
MTKWDKEYIKLCKKILKDGEEVENRTGVNTIKIPAYYFKLNVGKEFPVLTTKQLYFRQAITEMLWFYQAQSNDVRWLQDRNVHIWDEWMIDENGIWKATQNVLEDGRLVKKDIEKKFDKKYAYTIGTAYGYIVNKYKMTQNLIETIKNNPTDRRMVMSLWQNEFLETAVLPSCVWSTEWDVTDGYLNLWVHQRSADVPLGLPFNVTQYAVFLSLIAHVTGLKVGVMHYSIKDAHIYTNQIDGIKEQIKRYEENGAYDAPVLWINPEIKDFFGFDNSVELKDIKIKGYKHMGPISFKLTQ